MDLKLKIDAIQLLKIREKEKISMQISHSSTHALRCSAAPSSKRASGRRKGE